MRAVALPAFHQRPTLRPISTPSRCSKHHHALRQGLAASWRPRSHQRTMHAATRKQTGEGSPIAAHASAPEAATAGEEGQGPGSPPAGGLRLAVDRSPEFYEEGAPPLPRPGQFQQTLITSFTIGGVGLHTGEYSYVRVRPAYACEGRYFVRVPAGTNKAEFELPEPPGRSMEELATASGIYDKDPELEALKLQLFQTYLVAQEEEGFQGSFVKYLDRVDVREKQRILESLSPAEADKELAAYDWPFDEPEAIQARNVDDQVFPASLEGLVEGETVCQRLTSSDGEMLFGTELLLSALEACGVDNARIEIEGGSEIPVMDGSALGWVLEIQFAGLRIAPSLPGPDAATTAGANPAGGEAAAAHQEGGEGMPGEGQEQEAGGAPVRRRLLRPKESFIVREGDAFIQFMPEDSVRLTVGIDHAAKAEIIGKSWKSWSPLEDMHFRFELAGARQYIESPEDVMALSQMGYLKSGTESTVLVAHQDEWWSTELVRYPKDEPVRHALVDLIGDLALSASGGHGGLPIGHVIAYKPDHDLAVSFVRALHQNTTEEDWIEVVDVIDEMDYETNNGEGEGEGEEQEQEQGEAEAAVGQEQEQEQGEEPGEEEEAGEGEAGGP